MGECHQQVLRNLTSIFDRPLIENKWRGAYVEFLVAELVGAPWFFAGQDWGGHDLEHPDGTRVEIKQSAARQSWTASDSSKVAKPRFGIRAAKGFYCGADWTDSVSRRAHIYVFAWHPVASAEADHRNERQWEFYVASATRLPDGRASLGLQPLRAFATKCCSDELRETLEGERRTSGAEVSQSSTEGASGRMR